MRYIGKQLFCKSQGHFSAALRRRYQLSDLNACVIGYKGLFKSLSSGDNNDAIAARTPAAVLGMSFKPKQHKLHVSRSPGGLPRGWRRAGGQPQGRAGHVPGALGQILSSKDGAAAPERALQGGQDADQDQVDV